MNIIERIFLFAETQGIAVSAIEKKSGISNGFLKKIKYSPSNHKCEDILNAFPELNRNWLLTGKGVMLNSELQNIQSKQNNEDAQHEGILQVSILEDMYKEQLTECKIQINTLQKEKNLLYKEIGKLERTVELLQEQLEIKPRPPKSTSHAAHSATTSL